MTNRIKALTYLSFLLLLSGCTSPDSEERYNQFYEATEDMRSLDGSTGSGVVTDFSGLFYLSLSTTIDPDKPLNFATTVVVEDGLIDFSFQPLKTDTLLTGDVREDARTPAGDPIIVEDVPFADDGTFAADMGEVTMNGDANLISGRDIRAVLQLAGRVDAVDFFCGTVSGDVVFPIPLPLEGSTFGAILVTDGDLFSVTEPAVACPVTDTGDASDADAGTGETVE